MTKFSKFLEYFKHKWDLNRD